uniref:Endo/exonuclease/phosphatase domain-containing protein n=1 Tax=Rodentolepis nana TaxID=102285 RepID=A0A0R3TEL8_RODNA
LSRSYRKTRGRYELKIIGGKSVKSINWPWNGESQRLQILQGNAGGMSQDKKTQVQKILQTYDVDIFTIMEANLSDDKLKYYQFPGYTPYNLPKYRQVASGILTGVKEGLTSHYDLIKSMGSTQDIYEINRLNVWKCQNHFKIYTVYNPSQNCPNFDFLNISHKTVVLGDFSAHFTRWGYKNTNIAGKEIEDMNNSNLLEHIYRNEDLAT